MLHQEYRQTYLIVIYLEDVRSISKDVRGGIKYVRAEELQYKMREQYRKYVDAIWYMEEIASLLSRYNNQIDVMNIRSMLDKNITFSGEIVCKSDGYIHSMYRILEDPEVYDYIRFSRDYGHFSDKIVSPEKLKVRVAEIKGNWKELSNQFIKMHIEAYYLINKATIKWFDEEVIKYFDKEAIKLPDGRDAIKRFEEVDIEHNNVKWAEHINKLYSRFNEPIQISKCCGQEFHRAMTDYEEINYDLMLMK
jgi:hypothetical protein